ncbi:hypothetical protein K6U65_10165, partial [Vibrio vulnificus]
QRFCADEAQMGEGLRQGSSREMRTVGATPKAGAKAQASGQFSSHIDTIGSQLLPSLAGPTHGIHYRM